MTTIYLTGGAKNGKSALGQQLACRLAAGGPLYYLATMIPGDAEDRARIARHRREREGLGFVTLEQGSSLASLARPDGVYLVDSVTALLTNLMFPAGGFDPQAPQKAADDLRAFIAKAGGAVLISDYIGGDGGSYDEYTRSFIAGLAWVDCQLAACCDTMAELVAGIPIIYKGSLP